MNRKEKRYQLQTLRQKGDHNRKSHHEIRTNDGMKRNKK